MKSRKSKTNANYESAQTIKTPANWPDPEAIRRRAHEIFEQRAGNPGHELDDWLAAERELKTQRPANSHSD